MSSIVCTSSPLKKTVLSCWSNRGGTPIYPVLQSSSSVKVKVKSQAKNLQLVKGETQLYHDSFFQNISVSIKLTRIRSVKVQFLVKVKTYFSSLTTLIEDEDQSTGYIGVPPPWVKATPRKFIVSHFPPTCRFSSSMVIHYCYQVNILFIICTWLYYMY